MAPSLGPEIDYKQAAIKVAEVLSAFRSAASHAPYDQKLLLELEKLYLDLVRRAQWQSPYTRFDPLPNLKPSDGLK